MTTCQVMPLHLHGTMQLPQDMRISYMGFSTNIFHHIPFG